MYVGYLIDKENSTLKVVERVNGNRQYREFPLILEYYTPCESGRYRGYDGVRLKQNSFKNLQLFYNCKNKAQASGIKTYEADFNLPNKVLYAHYLPNEVPVLHKSFIDIECDRLGHENTTIKEMIEDAECPINAISIYNDWENMLYTLMLCPENLTLDEAREIAGRYENTFVFADEKDLLKSIMIVLNDCDVCVGWNSDAFDTPYIVRRIKNLLGDEEAKGLCLFGEEPKEKIITEQGQTHYEYSIPGKWFTDYLPLYKKNTGSVKESYKLDSIAEEELGENKVEYEGTLDDLYRDDYDLFIKYNRQDTMLVKKLDDKMNLIDIYNRMAHMCRVSLESSVGTVGKVDQAIINRVHDRGEKVPDRVKGKNTDFDGIVPPGAYVPNPVTGLAENIMSYDMNSLYPSSAMALNISPETMVGQLKLDKTIPYLREKIEQNDLWSKKAARIPDWGAAWLDEWGTKEYFDVVNKSDSLLTLKLVDGKELTITGKDLYNMIFSDGSNMNISPLGTIYRTDTDGVIKTILSEWFAERKVYKKKEAYYEDRAKGILLIDDLLISNLKDVKFERGKEQEDYDFDKLKILIQSKDLENLVLFMKENNLYLRNDNYVVSYDEKYYKERQDYWHLEQQKTKILLNSTYGALLNTSSVFFDFRLGASITMTGRRVWLHLASQANKLLCGEYTHIGGCIATGDTDSVYVSLNDAFKKVHPDFDFSRDNMVKFADKIGEEINKTFYDYMVNSFHCCDDGAKREKAGRECVASRALICGKKRYAMMVFDKDGYREDVNGKPGKLKIMGIQTQRSDLAKPVRIYLKKMINKLLTDGTREDLEKMAKDFYDNEWVKMKPWKQGTPKPLSKFDEVVEKIKNDKTGKVNIPSQIKAAFNFNNLIDYYGDTKTKKLINGDKVLVCNLQPNNPLRMDSVAVSIELNDGEIPQWFKELPFDFIKTDSKVDKTVETIFGVLNWDLSFKTLTYQKPDANDMGIMFV